MVEPLLAGVEPALHVEDRLPALDGDHAPGGKAAAIPRAIHLVDYRHVRPPGSQEIAVQGVDTPFHSLCICLFHSLHGGRERLRQNLAAEQRVVRVLLVQPVAEQVPVQSLQHQQRAGIPAIPFLDHVSHLPFTIRPPNSDGPCACLCLFVWRQATAMARLRCNGNAFR